MIRISSIPRLLECPSSAEETGYPYRPQSDVAALGTSAHEALAEIVEGSLPDISGIAKKNGCSYDELDRLVNYGRVAWSEIAEYFPCAKTEQAVTGDGIKGTADLLHNDGITLCVGDWKTGRVRRKHAAQLAGYAAAAVDMFGMPESGVVTICTIWVRFFELEVVHLDADDIERFYQSVKKAQLQIGKQYTPGSACVYCPNKMQCAARTRYISTVQESLVTLPQTQVLTREQLGGMYTRVKMLKESINMYDSILRNELANGDIITDDNSVLRLVDTTRDKVDATLAIPQLVSMLDVGEDEMLNAVSITKSAIAKIAGSRAGKGRKGKLQAEIIAKLKDTGAIKTTAAQRVVHEQGEQK